MSPPRSIDTPQISITSWILGGPLISSGNYHHRASSASLPAAAQTEFEIKGKKKKTSKPKYDGGHGAVLEGLEGFELVVADNAPTTRVDEVAKPTGTTAGSEKDKEKDTSRNGDKDKGQGKDEAKAGEGSSGWTVKQDETILAMKAETRSWKDIAAAVGTSKKDVRKRINELQSHAPSKGGGDAVAADASKSKEETADGREGEEHVKVGKNKDEKKDNDNDKDKNKGKAKGKEDAEKDGTEGKGRLMADEVWTREDCEVLEMLESRYTEQKWLQMQAGFYNMTGRMVIADIIQKKFSRG